MKIQGYMYNMCVYQRDLPLFLCLYLSLALSAALMVSVRRMSVAAIMYITLTGPSLE